MVSLAELMAEEEAKRLAEARAEIAAEKKAWNALTFEEKVAITDARNAKYAALDELPDEGEFCPDCGEADCDFDCEGDGDYDD